MKNVLIVTLGTRDVQLNVNSNMIATLPNELEVFPNDKGSPYTFKKPRIAGEYLLNNPYYTEYLTFPIVAPVIEYLKNKGELPHYLLLIVTNQQNVEERFRNNDTLYFGSLIENTLSNQYPEMEIDTYELGYDDKIIDVDAMYAHFGKQGKDLLLIPAEEVNKVYLLPQGGVDHINMPLTLKMIQHFRSKVYVLQRTEDNRIYERNFTRTFLKDLDRQKFIFLISNYYYDSMHLLLSDVVYKADDNSDIKLLRLLVAFCHHKVNLNIPEAKTTFNNIKKNYPDVANLLFIPEYEPGKDQLEVYRDLYISCKMAYLQQNYSLFMQRTYSLFENLWRFVIISTNELQHFIISHKNGASFSMNSKHPFYNEIMVYYDVNGLRKPNVLSYIDYIHILEYYQNSGHQIAERFRTVFENRNFFGNTARDWRNAALHGMRPINRNTLNHIFNNEGTTYTVEQLFEMLDPVFEIKGYGEYEKINSQIINIL